MRPLTLSHSQYTQTPLQPCIMGNGSIGILKLDDNEKNLPVAELYTISLSLATWY